ncbi:MAG: hypothetical protein V8Q77_04150 [Bacilli bacterium]
MKKKNVKHVVDEIRHFEILEYSNQQIALQLDDIILDYRSTLATVDTDANILASKRAKLKKLTDQRLAMMPLKNAFDNAQEEYNQLVGMYQTISKNIDEIENFVAQAKKLINVNQDFKQVVKNYSELLVKQVTLEQNKETYRIRNINLVETRKSKLNDPYGKEELQRIDEELKNVQDGLNTFENDLLAINQEMCRLKATEQDYKVITIYEECNECEEQLPSLYDKQRLFSSLVNDKYIYITNLKPKVANFDELTLEIDQLNDEIENN